MNGKRADVFVTQPDSARIRRNEAHEHIEAGGLARAVWAKQPRHFARLNLHGDLADHGSALIGLCEPLSAKTAQRPGLEGSGFAHLEPLPVG
jgi:hypothetical protein